MGTPGQPVVLLQRWSPLPQCLVISTETAYPTSPLPAVTRAVSRSCSETAPAHLLPPLAAHLDPAQLFFLLRPRTSTAMARWIWRLPTPTAVCFSCPEMAPVDSPPARRLPATACS